VKLKTATKQYRKSTKEAPIAARTQYLNSPFRLLEVIKMLMGPATGMEKRKPVSNPTKEIVIKLSIMVKTLLFGHPFIPGSSTQNYSGFKQVIFYRISE
jgi:hypothetical protein